MAFASPALVTAKPLADSGVAFYGKQSLAVKVEVEDDCRVGDTKTRP